MSKILEMMMKRKEMIENFEIYLKKIYYAIKLVIKTPEIYLFGSVIDGNLVAASDIDILVIADLPKSHLKRAEITAEIEKNAGLPLVHPFEFHIITGQEIKIWKDIYNLKYEEISSFLKD